MGIRRLLLAVVLAGCAPVQSDPPKIETSPGAKQARENLAEALKQSDEALAARLRVDRKFIVNVTNPLISNLIKEKAAGRPVDGGAVRRILETFAKIADPGEADRRALVTLRRRLDFALGLSKEDAEEEILYRDQWEKARALVKEKQPDKAAEELRQCAAGLNQVGDLVLVAHVLDELGDLASDRKHWNVARHWYEMALPEYRDQGDRLSEDYCLISFSIVAAAEDKPEEALGYREAALAIQRDHGDRAREQRNLKHIGRLMAQLGRPDDALRTLMQSLELARALGNPKEEGDAAAFIAMTYFELGRLAESVPYHKIRIEQLRKAGDREELPQALGAMGDISMRLGQFSEGLAYSEEALAIHQERGDREGEAVVRSDLGAILTSMGRHRDAIVHLEASLKLFREIGNKDFESTVLVNLGATYFAMGKLAEAARYFEDALALQRQTGDRPREALTRVNLGTLLSQQGRLRDALRQAEDALKIYRDLDDKPDEAVADIMVGTLYINLARYELGLKHFEHARQVQRGLKNRAMEAAAIGNIGLAYDVMGRPRDALACYEQMLAIQQELRNAPGEATCRNNIGAALCKLGRTDEALANFEQAFELFQKTGQRAMMAVGYGNIGYARFCAGRVDEAWGSFEEALKIHRELGNLSGEATALANLGAIQSERKKHSEAVTYFQQAVGKIEAVRASFGMMQSEKLNWFKLARGYYELAAAALRADGRAREAFDVLEQLRARGLLDTLGQTPATMRNVPAQTLARKEELRLACNERRARIDAVSKVLPLACASDRARLSGDAERARAELAKLEEELSKVGHEIELSQELEEIRPASADAVQASLRDGEALVAFAAMNRYEGRGADVKSRPVILAALLKRDSFELIEIEKTGSFDADVRWLRDAAVASARGYPAKEFRARARRVYDALFRPLEAGLAGARRMIVAPDEALFGLPFDALVASDAGDGYPGLDYLGRRFEIVTTYSATLLARRRAATPKFGDAFVAFGDPDYGSVSGAADRGSGGGDGADWPEDLKPFAGSIGGAERKGWARLPHSGEEVLQCSELFTDPCVRLKEEASERNARKIENARIVHFACHGYLDAADPMKSALVLTADAENDGYLEAREIADLRLPCELVVLSACDSGSGEMLRGEGLIGLTRAFMIAGAQSVVASLWTVSDEGGKEFMVGFYKKLAAGQDKAAALAETKREFMKHDKYSAPYYWAGFVLHGD